MRARENAVIVLNRIIEKKAYANLEIKDSIKVKDEREKGFAVQLIYGTIRYLLRLDYIISKFSKLKDKKISLPVKNILRISVYQILFLDKVPESAVCSEAAKLAQKFSNKGGVSFVNGVLRSFIREKDSVKYPCDETKNLMYYYSFPESIVNIILRDYGYAEGKKVLNALNRNKGICVRPNLLLTKAEDVEKFFEGAGFKKGEGCYYFEKIPPNFYEGYNRGLFTVQDRASMMCAELLAPGKGDTVLDLCAAPGGKSCYMAYLMENEGRIVSADIHPHRLELIEKNAQRLNVKIIETVLNDACKTNDRFIDGFDRVLVDAPCSGLGVIAKKPDIKWAEPDFESIAETQRKIIERAKKYVKKGGYMVYSTCTLNSDENENIVSEFLENNKNFIRVSDMIRLMPGNETDGFFMCRLERIA